MSEYVFIERSCHIWSDFQWGGGKWIDPSINNIDTNLVRFKSRSPACPATEQRSSLFVFVLSIFSVLEDWE